MNSPGQCAIISGEIKSLLEDGGHETDMRSVIMVVWVFFYPFAYIHAGGMWVERWL